LSQTYPSRIQIVALLTALLLGGYSIATILAETSTTKARSHSLDLTAAASGLNVSLLSDWASALAPLRGDLLANLAFAYSGPITDVLNTSNSPDNRLNRSRARELSISSLSAAPHSSDVWLLLAALARNDENRKPAIEALKMSYLTAPGDPNLIPARLLTFSTCAGSADPDLQSLARGDIRLILTRKPDLKPAISRAYKAAAAEMKNYLYDTVKSLDPGFASSLQ
jgi:hypothetical protein